MAHTTYWSSTNETIGVILSMMMIDAPMPGQKPTFRENAEGWETGIMKKFSTKLSARFSSLSGVDAYEVVTTLEADGEVYYFSNWYVQVGDVSYCLTITSPDRDQLFGEETDAFLKSFRLQKGKKTANQALQTAVS